MSTDCSRASTRPLKGLRLMTCRCITIFPDFFSWLRIACDLTSASPHASSPDPHSEPGARSRSIFRSTLAQPAATTHVCAQCSGAFKTVVVWNPICEFIHTVSRRPRRSLRTHASGPVHARGTRVQLTASRKQLEEARKRCTSSQSRFSRHLSVDST